MHPATNSFALVRSQIEARFPAAFVLQTRHATELLSTGIPAIDTLTQGGIPLNCLTEICGSSVASSGKTTLAQSLIAQATRQGRFCALIDASDSFDPLAAEATGADFSHLLWVRCGKRQAKLRPLEQAFKAPDMLLQSSGFGLIVVDLGGIAERVVHKVPMSTWLRFSRVVESRPTALVFIEQQPHATSCAGLVLRLTPHSATFSIPRRTFQLPEPHELPASGQRYFVSDVRTDPVGRKPARDSGRIEAPLLVKEDLSRVTSSCRSSVFRTNRQAEDKLLYAKIGFSAG